MGWNRTSVDGTSSSVGFDSVSTGTFDQSEGGFFGFDTSDSGSGPGTSLSSAGGIALSVGESLGLSYSFDTALAGGTAQIAKQWQFTDYQLELFGGDATWNSSAVTFGSSEAQGVAGVDYHLSGDGTNIVTFDAISVGSYFSGSLGITGEYTGLRITEMFNSNTPTGGSHVIDEDAGIALFGFSGTGSAVPEPSTAFLSLSALCFLLRRRR